VGDLERGGQGTYSQPRQPTYQKIKGREKRKKKSDRIKGGIKKWCEEKREKTTRMEVFSSMSEKNCRGRQSHIVELGIKRENEKKSRVGGRIMGERFSSVET